MNLQKLFDMQRELDLHIEENHPRINGESRLKEKVTALLVELGELANEIRFFKFWSNRPASEKQIVLEEFVDGVHFILSLGLEMGVETLEIHSIQSSSLNDQFIGLFNAVSLLGIQFSEKAYGHVFSAYIGLGEMLGFNWGEIETAYLAKNTINHARQKDFY